MAWTSVFGFCTFAFGLAYAALMRRYWLAWRQLPDFEASVPNELLPVLSVLVPARNEAAHITACLNSIVENDYPPEKLEILVLDDHSEDDTAGQAEAFSQKMPPGMCRVLRLSEWMPLEPQHLSFKKMAIQTGIQVAQGTRILCIDADCRLAPGVLRLHGSAGEKMGIGPVVFDRTKSVLEHFQALDFLGLMGITGAGLQLRWHRMGNGANLSYPKKLFLAVNGFKGSEHLASGDDMFLIQKVAAFDPGLLVYLKNPAAVYTAAQADLTAFFRQRIRWGSKNKSLPEWQIKAILAQVWLFCWMLLIGTGVWLFHPGWNLYSGLLVGAWLCKAVSDYFFLREMAMYFHQKHLMPYFWPSFFLHTFYIAAIGSISILAKEYRWKGRKVS